MTSGSYDDGFFSIPIGFDFPFYGNTYSQVYASTNGLLTFGQGSTSLSGQDLPNSSAPNNLIAVFWDDLVMRDRSLDERDSRLLYSLRGTAPNRALVIEWRDFSFLGGNNYLTFEAVLHEDGTIQTLFHEMTGNSDSDDDVTGSGASFGIEDSAGTQGLSMGYRQAGTVGPGTVFTYRPDGAGGYQSDSLTNLVGSFDDIRSSGTDVGLSGDDVLSSPIDIGFTFTFYGTDYTQVTASTNGWVGMGTGFTNSLLSNGDLPNGSSGYPMVACFWDDGDTGTDSKLYSKTVGTAGNRTFILMYDKWHFCCSDNATVTYEVRFHEATGTIDCLYGSLDGSTGTRHLGDSATVGIQNGAGDKGLARVFDSADLGPGARVSFFPKSTGNSDYRGYGPDVLFTDISGSGTLSTASGDDEVQDVTLPFTFTYYGQAVTMVTISTNGHLNLEGLSDFSNDHLPSSNAPAGLMGPYWDDLDITDPGQIFYETLGSAGSRVFVVQWNKAGFLSYSGSELTFQVRLHERDGSIEYLYGPMLGGSASASRVSGDSATLGLQSEDRTQGLQCSYDRGGTVLSGSAYFFHQ